MNIPLHLINNKAAYIDLCIRHHLAHPEDAYQDLFLYWGQCTPLQLELILTPDDLIKHSRTFLKQLSKAEHCKRTIEISFSSMDRYNCRFQPTEAIDTKRHKLKLEQLETIESNKALLTQAQLTLLNHLAHVNYSCWRLALNTGISKTTLYRKYSKILHILRYGKN